MKSIVCHHCRWEHIPGLPYWECECGELMDVFDAENKACSSCGHPVSMVQCPRCAIIKPFEWWMGVQTEEAAPGITAFATNASACEELYHRAVIWMTDREQYFLDHPESRPVWFQFLDQKAGYTNSIQSVIGQLAEGKGFALFNPVSGSSISLFETAVALLGAGIADRYVPGRGIRDTGITDEYTICLDDGMMCMIYNFVATGENRQK